MVKMITDID